MTFNECCKLSRIENKIKLKDIAEISGKTISRCSNFENNLNNDIKVAYAYVRLHLISKNDFIEYGSANGHDWFELFMGVE